MSPSDREVMSPSDRVNEQNTQLNMRYGESFDILFVSLREGNVCYEIT